MDNQIHTSARMRFALLATDNREHSRNYVAPVPYFGTAPEGLLQGFALLPEVELHVVSCARARMQSPAQLAPNIFFHSLYVPKLGWMRTGYLGCIRAVRRCLQQLRPALVHGQGTERDCAMEAAFSGFPNVVTLHGNMVDSARVEQARVGSYHWCTARLENLALRRTSGVFCNSQYTQALVRPRARGTWLVPNALREVFFSTPSATGKPLRPVLLHVGVVCPNKQQLKALQLARSLRGKGLDFELHFIGDAASDTPYVQDFLVQLRQAEQQGYARFFKALPAKELIERFDRASALLHTPQAEAFGLVVAEALTRNLKCFGLGVGGVPDIIADTDSGVLVPPGEWIALEAAIESWLRCGAPAPPPAAAVMRQRYHPLAVAKRHLEIYQEVLSRRS